MEHLLLAGGVAPLHFSLIGSADWDGGDFLSYPQRHNWDPSIWEWSDDEVKLDPHGRSLDDLAAFLQTWLFFGLLETIIGKAVSKHDFTRLLNPEQDIPAFITTANLMACLEDFKASFERLSDEERIQREDIIWDALSEAMIVNHRLTQKFSSEDTYPGSETLQETLLCQTLLYLTLSRFVAELIPGIDWTMFERPTFQPLLEKRMKAAGWCPFDVQFLRVTFDPDVMAFIYSLGYMGSSRDHRRCHERFLKHNDYCVADSMDASHIPKHVERDCACPLLGPDMEDIATAIRNGTVPIVAVSASLDSQEDVELLLWEEELEESRLDLGRYFAISHVWKEGLGNPQSNKLPRCQIRRIANLLFELEASEQGKSIKIAGPRPPGRRLTMPFWLDIFCVPVRPEQQDLRNMCISRMRKIYESATAVVILDPDM